VRRQKQLLDLQNMWTMLSREFKASLINDSKADLMQAYDSMDSVTCIEHIFHGPLSNWGPVKYGNGVKVGSKWWQVSVSLGS